MNLKFTIQAGRVFVGTNEKTTVDDVSISISDGKIHRIEKKSTENQTKPSMDASDYIVLPGLIDLHVHLTLDGDGKQATISSNLFQTKEFQTLKAAKHASTTAAAGFTTVRDLGASGAQVIALRDAIESGMFSGPRIFAAGIPLSETGGHADNYVWPGRICDGADDVRKAVREQIRMGADCIKICASAGGGGGSMRENPNHSEFSVSEISVAVEEAHAKYKKVAAHAHSTAGMINAALSGVDTIEHGLFMTNESATILKKQNCTLVPTMSAPIMVLKAGVSGGAAEWHVKRVEKYLDMHANSVSLAKKTGIPIAFGTDVGTTSNFHGTNAKEFGFLVEKGGLSAGEALLAATGNAAKALGMEQYFGSIETGKFADFTIVKHDPLDDIKTLEDPSNIVAVMKEGKLLKCIDSSLRSDETEVEHESI